MIKKGIVWDSIGRFFNQGIGFFISIFLARLLTPEDFGLVGMVLAFIGVAHVFIEMGLGSALIQKDSVSQVQYSSVFWLNLIVSSVLTVSFYFSAKLIANFYNQKEIIPIVQVLSLTFILNSLGIVNKSILTKKMNFKVLSIITLTSVLLSGIVGIYLAYKGMGVWAIVSQNLLGIFITQLLLIVTNRWIPSFSFCFKEIDPLWKFSSKLFITNIIHTIFYQLDVFVISKLFNPTILGYYSRGKNIDTLISNYSSGSLTNVLFPALSKIKSDKLAVKEKVIQFYQVVAFLSFYLGGLLYLIGEDIIVLLFTDKWLPTVPYFRVMVLATFANPLSAILVTAVQSMGRTDLLLRVEVLKNIVILITYIIGFNYGLIGFLYALLLCKMIGLTLNGFYTWKVIDWSVWSQWKTVLPFVPIAIVGVLPIFYLSEKLFVNDHLLHLLAASTCFTIYYFLTNYILKTNGFLSLLNNVKPLLKKFNLS